MLSPLLRLRRWLDLGMLSALPLELDDASYDVDANLPGRCPCKAGTPQTSVATRRRSFGGRSGGWGGSGEATTGGGGAHRREGSEGRESVLGVDGWRVVEHIKQQ